MTDNPASTQCVYTIVHPDVVEAALARGGSGEFQEGRAWVTAHRHIESLGKSDPYPLLLGDATAVTGVQWVADIESIKLLDDEKTRVRFSSLARLSQPIPLRALRKLSDRTPLSDNYIRPYVPCFVSGEPEEAILSALQYAGPTAEELAFREIDLKSAGDFVAALSAVEDRITTKQRAMLVGHALAPGQALSMARLAELGGYDSFQSANLQYGKLGRLVADYFGVDCLANQTQALAYAYSQERDEQGHWVWLLREPLLEALRVLGWVPRTEFDLQASAAAREVDADPQTRGVQATVRQALIEARIGQGAYRARMLELWGGRCAVTGCRIREVLVASHAKPWAESSNEERLDEYNGLLLAAHVDRLFDAGLISFADDGAMLVGPELPEEALRTLGLAAASRLRLVHDRHKPYLAAHRAKHGFDA